MNDLTAAVHGISRGLLDQVPGAREVIIVLSDDTTVENLNSVMEQIEYSGGAVPPLFIDVEGQHISKSLLSFACDGYVFHYYRQSDLVKEIKGE